MEKKEEERQKENPKALEKKLRRGKVTMKQQRKREREGGK